MIGALARFRVDPEKVRVSIRRRGDEWRATLTERKTNIRVCWDASDPEYAMDRALDSAEGIIDGIDLGMGCAYVHPFGVKA